MLTQERLKELVTYDVETGIFTRIKAVRGKGGLGTSFGGLDSNGYIKCSIDNHKTYGHRLAFLYMTGNIPKEIDHIDGNPSNNSWGNLREVTRSQNHMNGKLHRDSSSGVKGLHYRKRDSVWKACVIVKGIQYQKSLAAPFDCENTKTILTEWLRAKREELHKEFARHE